MSVCVIMKLKVEPERMKELFVDRVSELEAVKDQALSAGALHHLFAAGDGEVMIVDEWGDAASFERFFDNPTIAGFMAETGAQGPPEVSIFEVLDSPDRF